MRAVPIAGSFLALAAEATQKCGGTAPWQYCWDDTKLVMPPDSAPPYSHGLEVDSQNNLYLTYYDTGNADRCLLRWSKQDGYKNYTVIGEGSEICKHGDNSNGPHGLRYVREEDGMEYFYHANNNQALFKTFLNGDLVWKQCGQDSTATSCEKPTPCVHGKYCPTWFGHQPGSDFVYMTDGYGNDQIHVYKTNGSHTGIIVGGKGDASQHGKFNTPHSISWDPRKKEMVVSDRANNRLEYFEIDKSNASVFKYKSTTTYKNGSQHMGTACNARFLTDMGMMIVPTLEGYVFIFDKDNNMVSQINVFGLLGKGYDHPHDAIFLPNGDFVVATWNPGRIAYFTRQADPASAMCKNHPGCSDLHPLDGLCCPVADGTRLACCDPEPDAAMCKNNPGCTDLDGLCCPAGDGTRLACCDKDTSNALWEISV